jgi:hypothetical protein
MVRANSGRYDIKGSGMLALAGPIVAALAIGH